MGVYHFMGVGKAVGAVTCAVDYIEKALDAVNNNSNSEAAKLFKGSGGINHDEVDRGKIEVIVLFTSKEVINNKLKAFPYNGCDEPDSVRNEIVKNLKSIWKRADHDEGRKIFWCEVDIDDFQDCFNKVLKVAYRFSQQGKQGKEIWCNLTGGSNSIGFAMMSVARMTALSTKLYLISQRREYQKEIKVPAKIKKIHPKEDGYFNLVPFIKTSIDTVGFYDILDELSSFEKGISTEELLNRLKGKQHFTDCSLEEFKKQYMLKLYGLGYTEYDQKTDCNKISDFGENFFIELDDLEKDLSQRNVDIVSESKTWDWFKEVDKI